MEPSIKIEGLAEFARALKKLDSNAPKELRVAFNDAAMIVVTYGKRRMPRRSGRAQSTIKAKSTRTAVRVSEGGKRAPYVPWLDFGGKVGARKSIERQYIKGGRYLYPALRDERNKINDAVVSALQTAAQRAGLEVE